ncbi:hypothetical protein EV356DRAFT_203029 [Viridothelium virens]|uniref:Uncharacterized protein n=1 Tax=Viridothelium virens TaxID=1048519 RepID=A0A6A6H7I4_VIRVR|nr:hypothetical protein EV356DRAFT_203029 [Viridothelium virens]
MRASCIFSRRISHTLIVTPYTMRTGIRRLTPRGLALRTYFRDWLVLVRRQCSPAVERPFTSQTPERLNLILRSAVIFMRPVSDAVELAQNPGFGSQKLSIPCILSSKVRSRTTRAFAQFGQSESPPQARLAIVGSRIQLTPGF